MFPSAEKEVLSWETRVKIAIGIAKGVAFLHSFYNSSLYFELRMHNIMLDEVMTFFLFITFFFFLLMIVETNT